MVVSVSHIPIVFVDANGQSFRIQGSGCLLGSDEHAAPRLAGANKVSGILKSSLRALETVKCCYAPWMVTCMAKKLRSACGVWQSFKNSRR